MLPSLGLRQGTSRQRQPRALSGATRALATDESRRSCSDRGLLLHRCAHCTGGGASLAAVCMLNWRLGSVRCHTLYLDKAGLRKGRAGFRPKAARRAWFGALSGLRCDFEALPQPAWAPAFFLDHLTHARHRALSARCCIGGKAKAHGVREINLQAASCSLSRGHDTCGSKGRPCCAERLDERLVQVVSAHASQALWRCLGAVAWTEQLPSTTSSLCVPMGSNA